MKKQKIIISVLLVTIGFLYIVWGITISKLQDEMTKEKTIINVQIDTLDYMFAIEHIKKFESFSDTPYQVLPDTSWYIGYGYKMSSKHQFSRIDTATGDSLLRSVLMQKIKTAHKTYGYNNSKLLGISMLMYRVGEGKLRTFKLHKHLLNHNQDSINIEWLNINQFNDTIHAQMNERCIFENKLFNN